MAMESPATRTRSGPVGVPAASAGAVGSCPGVGVALAPMSALGRTGGVAPSAKLAAGVCTVTATTPTTMRLIAAGTRTAGRSRRGSRPWRTGISRNRYERSASVIVRATRTTNSGQMDRPVRAGVSHRKMGQWNR